RRGRAARARSPWPPRAGPATSGAGAPASAPWSAGPPSRAPDRPTSTGRRRPRPARRARAHSPAAPCGGKEAATGATRGPVCPGTRRGVLMLQSRGVDLVVTAIVPIVLLLVLGWALRHRLLTDQGFW